MTGPRRRRRGSAPAARKVEIRLSEGEHAAIAAASARGPGRALSIARFVTEAALSAAGATPPAPKVGRTPSRLALAELMDAVTAVNRTGNNLNQLARERNATGLRPVGSWEVEQRALAALQRLADVAERIAGGAA
jgi:hypothetical protein